MEVPGSCSLCYETLTKSKAMFCGNCKKRCYCSRACQLSDWKQHKLWCGRVAELNVDFEVRSAGIDKGLGVFALRVFEAGDKILAERPVIHATEADVQQAESSIVRQFAACSPAVKAAVMGLHVDPDDALVDGLRQFKRNNFSLDPGSGLFILASRFNHACLPNCDQYFVKDHGLFVFSVGRHIASGEELTVSYAASNQFHVNGLSAFQATMLRVWGFTCSCAACGDAAVFARIAESWRLDEEFIRLGQAGSWQLALEAGGRLVDLYDELGVGALRRQRTYCFMFQMAMMLRPVTAATAADAAKCARKALLNMELCIGGSGKDPIEITRFRLCVADPDNHRLHLAMRA